MSTLYADAHYLIARMLRRTVRNEDGCWIFQGATNSTGYGIVCSGRKGRNVLTHRLMVIARDGSIPDGMTVDHRCHDSHLCRDVSACPHRRCVNPAHLVVMTTGENTSRRWEAGLCAAGHQLTFRPDGKRRCKQCARDYAARARAAKVLAPVVPLPEPSALRPTGT